MPDDEELREKLARALYAHGCPPSQVARLADALLPVVERYVERRVTEARQDLAAYLMRVYEHARADALNGKP
jgi:hypothetical protein